MEQKKLPIVVNLIGGPGSGKSTIAAGLFYFLTISGVKVELATEYAKDKVYDKSFKTLDDQFYVFGKQFHKIWRLVEDNDVIITDSPIILSAFYNKMESNLFGDLVIEQYKRFNPMTYFIDRETEYQTYGRCHTEEEAKSIDEGLKKILEANGIPYMVSKTTKAVDDILAALSLKLDINLSQRK